MNAESIFPYKTSLETLLGTVSFSTSEWPPGRTLVMVQIAQVYGGFSHLSRDTQASFLRFPLIGLSSLDLGMVLCSETCWLRGNFHSGPISLWFFKKKMVVWISIMSGTWSPGGSRHLMRHHSPW